MQPSCRGVYWLTASPWALGRETGVVEREPHANDVWSRLRLWSRLSGRAHSACRSHTPASFLHVQLLLPRPRTEGRRSSAYCLPRSEPRSHPFHPHSQRPQRSRPIAITVESSFLSSIYQPLHVGFPQLPLKMFADGLQDTL
jgi:hypothetical protein